MGDMGGDKKLKKKRYGAAARYRHVCVCSYPQKSCKRVKKNGFIIF